MGGRTSTRLSSGRGNPRWGGTGWSPPTAACSISGTPHFYGSIGGQHLNAPVVGIAATSDGQGYWLVASDGGVFPFGARGVLGSMGGLHLNAPVVGIATSDDDGGYLVAASDGGVFRFGTPRSSAQWAGST